MLKVRRMKRLKKKLSMTSVNAKAKTWVKKLNEIRSIVWSEIDVPTDRFF